MDIADPPKITCPNCGKRYLWKPQFRGKRVTCACGEKFTVDSPAEAGASGADGYDLQPDSVAPALKAGNAAAAKPAPVLQYRGPNQETRPHGRILPGSWNVPELSAVAAMLALGAGCKVLLPMMQDAVGTPRLALAMTLVFLGLTLNVLLMLAGVRLAAAFIDLPVANVAQVVVKLAIVFVLAVAAGGFCASLDKFNTNGIIFGVHVLFILYWILFGLLFRTNVMETMWTVSIIALLQAMVNFGVWKL